MEIVLAIFMSKKMYTINEAYSEQTGLSGIKDWLNKQPAGARFVTVFNVSNVMMGMGYTTWDNNYGAALVFSYGGLYLYKKLAGVWSDPIQVK